MSEALQKKLASEIEKFNSLQKEFQKYVSIRQRLEAQLTENMMVHDEMELVEDQSTVYKLIGPALVKQDLVEAKQNVNKRITYITDELKRNDTAIKGVEEKQEVQRDIISKLQAQFQSTKA